MASRFAADGPLLVIGRNGQLATDLVEASHRLGLPVIAHGRPSLDLARPETIGPILKELRPAAIINAAAYTAVDKAETEPELAFALNRDGPARLAQHCAELGLPLIHLSTDQVFDGRKEGGYVETDAPNPLCIYGRSKLAGEERVRATDPSALIVRVSWVFGPSADNFVKRVLAWARSRETVTVVSDQHGRPTYSPALAEVLIDLAGRMGGPSAPRGLLHVAGGSVMTRYEQALAVVEAARRRGGPTLTVEPVATRDFPTPATRPLNAELDPGLADSRYGFRLRSFAEDLDRTLDRLIGPIRPST